MKNRTVFATLILIAITAAWGLTFPLIKNTIQAFPPLTFVGLRFLMASLSLAPYVLATKKSTSDRLPFREAGPGLLLGLCLFLGYSFQTAGLRFTTASKAGFITGISVALVPFLSIITDTVSVRWNSWLGVALSVGGLALLSLTGKLGINMGDCLVLICAFAFALHIVLVGKYAGDLNPARLAWIQITVCGLLSSIGSLVIERPNLPTLTRLLAEPRVLVPLLFCSLIATSAAYLVQNIFQKHSTPVRTALIFTCEPIFSAIFAFILSGETLNSHQMGGCLLMITGMLFAECGDSLIWHFRNCKFKGRSTNVSSSISRQAPS